jgi:hypothetical protein
MQRQTAKTKNAHPKESAKTKWQRAVRKVRSNSGITKLHQLMGGHVRLTYQELLSAIFKPAGFGAIGFGTRSWEG